MIDNPLAMFRAGADYIEIAAHFGTSEAIVERVIARLRDAQRMEDRLRAATIKQSALTLLSRNSTNWQRRKAELAELRAERPA
jgi:hypothetical protein